MLEIAIIFILGTVVGSFVNVLAARTVTGKSIIFPRSFCDACAKPLWRRDMIPVVSFFLLRARCRFCRVKLSWQYPIVEFVVGTLFAIAWTQFSGAALFSSWIAIMILVALFLTDVRAMVLPARITHTAIIFFLAFDFFTLGSHPLNAVRSLAVGIIIGGGFFFLQYVVSRGAWIGEGDIWLGLLMAVILRRWELVVIAIFLGYIIGAIVSVGLLARHAKKLKSEVPLGAFLTVATIIVLLSERLIPLLS